MNYELVKKLQEAGYPVFTPDVPELSEPIEDCDMFHSLYRNYISGQDWIATGIRDGDMDNPIKTNGQTPEEAVANLWLELNHPQ